MFDELFELRRHTFERNVLRRVGRGEIHFALETVGRAPAQRKPRSDAVLADKVSKRLLRIAVPNVAAMQAQKLWLFALASLFRAFVHRIYKIFDRILDLAHLDIVGV